MESVFISSIQRGYEEIRVAARRAIESLGMRPLMAEAVGGSTMSPQRALLDLVSEADVVLLILGPRFSQPTEDEFNEAARLSKEILVVRQDGGCDADQAEFVDRVAGGWKGGRLWGSFVDAGDVGFAVVRALSNRAALGKSAELGARASAEASERAAGTSTHHYSGGGSVARTALAPLVPGVLLDAVKLEWTDLGDRVAGLAREHRLVAQSVGIEAGVTKDGVSLQRAQSHTGQPLAEVGANGTVVVTSDVGGSDQLGSMRVDPEKLETAIRNAGTFAQAVWDYVDDREEVQQVAVAVGIPNAQNKVFGTSTGSNSISMGGFGMPQRVVVPKPAAVVRRAEIGTEPLARRLVAEVRRVFTDSGAVEP